LNFIQSVSSNNLLHIKVNEINFVTELSIELIDENGINLSKEVKGSENMNNLSNVSDGIYFAVFWINNRKKIYNKIIIYEKIFKIEAT